MGSLGRQSRWGIRVGILRSDKAGKSSRKVHFMRRITTKRGAAHPTQWMLALPISAAVFFGGCSGASAPDTIKVQGKVTCQGQPLTEGTVSFVPVEPAEGHPSRAATGIIQPDGTYQLATFGENDGAVPGTYQVTVVSITSGPTLEEPGLPEVWAIPKKYGNAVQSGLTATIPPDAGGPLELNFALED